MTKILETKLAIESWDEKPTREFDDGSKFARAEVSLGGDDAAVTSAVMEMTLYYRADGTSTYAWLLRVAAALEGRTGTFVTLGEGSFDGKTASGTGRVLAGSGELARLSGTVESVSTHADYPNMPLTLTYDLG